MPLSPMLKFFTIYTFYLIVFTKSTAQSQTVKIPETMYFAGMKLTLSNGAREAIEKDYVSIMKSPKYFSSIVQRADLYFPIIEKIFNEEAAPADFKFLALQESSLQSDVVSKSNAVGYWQFKKESAQEVGLQVDSDIDERKNIAVSSKGAAKYLKKSNQILNNWVYTLLAYYLGRSGVMPYVKEKYRNSNEMDIDQDMNWYVLRFLAHKFAYEMVVGQVPHPQLRLALYKDCNGKSLKEISDDKKIDLAELENYNKWLATNKVPEGRAYTVILPFKIDRDISGENVVVADRTETKTSPISTTDVAVKNKKNKKSKSDSEQDFNPLDLPLVVNHNKLRAVQARTTDSFAKLAYAGKITVNQFLAHNELQDFDVLIPGQLYYVEAKRGKALVLFHTVKAKETIWSIAQLYGIRTASIRKKNRMKSNENIQEGQILYLRNKKPKTPKSPNNATTPLFMKTKEVTPSSEPEPVKIAPAPVSVAEPVVETTTEIEQPAMELASGPIANTNAPAPPTIEKPAPILTHNTKDVINSTILPDSVQLHTVVAGQTLYQISKTYTVNVDSLKKWNTLPSNEISVGRQLIVKNSTQQKTTTNTSNANTYTVKKGDTIYKIAKEHGVRVEDILLWNNKDTNNVSIGEVLVVKK